MIVWTYRLVHDIDKNSLFPIITKCGFETLGEAVIEAERIVKEYKVHVAIYRIERQVYLEPQWINHRWGNT